MFLCILYTSTAQFDKQYGLSNTMSQIVLESEAHNDVSGITCALVYKNGKYLHMIEGPSRKIDELFVKLANDNRHAHIEKLIDIPVKERSFPNCNIKLMFNAYEDKRLVNFVAKNKEVILSSGSKVKETLGFFGINNIDSLEPSCQDNDSNFYNNKGVKLISRVDVDWFDFGGINVETALAGINVSEAILNQETSYVDLFKIEGVNDSETLVNILNVLVDTGKLVVSNAIVSNKSKIVKDKSKNKTFSSKLLSWLSLK